MKLFMSIIIIVDNNKSNDSIIIYANKQTRFTINNEITFAVDTQTNSRKYIELCYTHNKRSISAFHQHYSVCMRVCVCVFHYYYLQEVIVTS